MATLSSSTSFASGDSVTPAYLNSKIDPLIANISAVNDDISGAWYNVKNDFGAVGGSLVDDTASILSAIAVAGQAGRRSSVIFFPAGTYRTTSPISTTYAGVKFVAEGFGSSIISSDHTGPVFAVNSNNIEIRDLEITGSGYTYGSTRNSLNVGVQLSGLALNFRFTGGTITSTGSYCIFYAADSGDNSLIADTVLTPSFSTTVAPRVEAAIGHRGQDAGSVPRFLDNIITDGQLFEIQGVNDIFASNCFAHNISMDSRAQNVYMQGVRLGTQGSPTTITGTTIELWGGGHAGNIVLDSNAVNCIVATSTVSGITDAAAAGRNLILGGIYGNTAGGHRLNVSRFVATHPANALYPHYTFASEESLGLYRSAASTIAMSYGTFDLRAARLSSVKTSASLGTSAGGVTSELWLTVGLSVTTLNYRSGNTTYYFASSANTDV